MTEWSEWKVGEHRAGCTIWYTVFRDRDIKGNDHDKAREFSGGYYHTERIAQLLANELNKEDN